MTAIAFPGQGSQFVGMSRDFYDNFSEVREIYELIQDVTKINIRQIIFDNPSDFLNQTQYTQISIFCASISMYKILSSLPNFNKLDINFMLGHSLGEYTALCAAKILTIKETALLLKKRGELMQNSFESNKSGMAALIGFDSNKIENIIQKNNLKLQIANDNSPQQIVISGINEDIAKSENLFKKEGLKRFVYLKVSAAFHSNLMLPAQNKMEDFINNSFFETSTISIISNSTGEICKNVDEIKNNLLNQMSSKVKWVDSVKSLNKVGEKDIIEIGPGNVLSGLIKRISTDFNIKNFNNISDIESFNNEI
tara:strand:- start:332 stop:1261 length:930 start_codon:yes stop_codon:yes gene_type:complete